MKRLRAAGASDTWRLVGKSAGVRLVILPVSAVLGLFNTRLIIDHFGSHAYLQYGLLVGLAGLLPFADLGISAAIMNATAEAEEPRTDDGLRGVLITSIRILAGAMVVVITVAAVLTFSGAWPALLGRGLVPGAGAVAAGLCLAVFGINLSVGFGQRILIGLGRNHVAVLLLGLQTPIMLVVILVVVALDVPAGNYLAVVAYGVLVLLGAAALWQANRLVKPVIGQAVRAARHVRTVRGGRVFDVGWPLLVQMIALPLALQTDRILLSHLSSLHQLAIYTLASQLFTPVLGVISSAGVALWPIFAKARARGTDEGVTSPNVLALGFGGAAAAACLILSLASPWLAGRASDGRIGLPVGVLAAFTLLMIVQAARYPLGSYLTDARGLRYQAWMILGMLPVNLALSWVLASSIGAAGPVIGSVISMSIFQLYGTWAYVERERRQRNATQAAHRLEA